LRAARARRRHKLTSTAKAETEKEETTATLVITKLTDDELTGTAPKGEKVVMKRVKEKDKK
jgi:hypothetical protein